MTIVFLVMPVWASDKPDQDLILEHRDIEVRRLEGSNMFMEDEGGAFSKEEDDQRKAILSDPNDKYLRSWPMLLS